MVSTEIKERLEACPIIAAVRRNGFEEALESEAEVIFLLEAELTSAGEKIAAAHQKGKYIFVHIDLMHGIGKDKYGVEYLASMGADGIITTKAALIKSAKDARIVSVQRCFALDSQGLASIEETVRASFPDFIEIMPGTVGKVIERFASKNIPVIAGGLIETKQEVISALKYGAFAVSTGKKELWSI